MDKELNDTKDFLQNISDYIHVFVKKNSPDSGILFFQILIKFVFFLALIYLVDFLLRLLINTVFKLVFDKEEYPILKAVYGAKITNSISRLLALLVGSFAVESFFYRHPKSYDFLERLIGLLLVIVVAKMLMRGG